MDEKRIMIEKELLDAKYFVEDEIDRESERWPKYSRTFIVCIDSFENGVAAGRLHNYYYQGEDVFQGLDQLLFAMEDVMEKAEVPIRSSRFRTTKNTVPKKRMTAKEINAILAESAVLKLQPHYTPDTICVKRGNITNFYIYPLCRSHASLQGILAEAGKDNTQFLFRSEMELLFLLREAIENANNKLEA